MFHLIRIDVDAFTDAIFNNNYLFLHFAYITVGDKEMVTQNSQLIIIVLSCVFECKHIVMM